MGPRPRLTEVPGSKPPRLKSKGQAASFEDLERLTLVAVMPAYALEFIRSTCADSVGLDYVSTGTAVVCESSLNAWQSSVRHRIEAFANSSCRRKRVDVVGFEGGHVSRQQAQIMPRLLRDIGRSLANPGVMCKWICYSHEEDFKAELQYFALHGMGVPPERQRDAGESVLVVPSSGQPYTYTFGPDRYKRAECCALEKVQTSSFRDDLVVCMGTLIQGYIESVARSSRYKRITVVGLQGEICPLQVAEVVPDILYEVKQHLQKLRCEYAFLRWSYYLDAACFVDDDNFAHPHML